MAVPDRVEEVDLVRAEEERDGEGVDWRYRAVQRSVANRVSFA